MKKKLVSLSCCGESIEKVLTLYYFAFLENRSFYEPYAVELFYAHNLPKKVSSHSAHGTIAFYEKYLRKVNSIPPCDQAFLLRHKKRILERLIYYSYITPRSAELLAKDDCIFWNYLKQLPFSYLYDTFIQDIKFAAMQQFQIHTLGNLKLEKNILKFVETTTENKSIYKIYSLDTKGCIGRHQLSYRNVYDKIHFITDLEKKSVLSGNSATLLKLIHHRIGMHTIIGYLEHKSIKRTSWNTGLSELLQNRESVLEPKIYTFNALYKDLSPSLSPEERGNLAFAKGYREFLEYLIPKAAHKNSWDCF